MIPHYNLSIFYIVYNRNTLRMIKISNIKHTATGLEIYTDTFFNFLTKNEK